MKYGKEFQHILEDSSFPPDWKDSAIEYRQLKKLIKNVVSELTSMGLSPGVLHKLLVTEDTSNSLPTTSVPSASLDAYESDEEVLEFEFESPEGSPATIQQAPSQPKHRSQSYSHKPPQEVVVDPVPANSPTMPEIASPHPHHHRKFRLRLLSETDAGSSAGKKPDPPLRAMSVAEFLDYREKQIEAAKTPPPDRQESTARKVVRKAVMDGHGGVKAEYILTGDPNNPTPQLRLHLSTSPSPPADSNISFSTSPSPSPSNTDTDTEDEPSDTDVEPPASSSSASASATPRPFNRFGHRSLPSSPTLNTVRSASSPIWAIASGKDLSQGMGGLSLDSPVGGKPSSPLNTRGPSTPKAKTRSTSTTPDTSLAAAPSISEPSARDSVDKVEVIPEIADPPDAHHEREFIIPLSSDLAFFHLLTSALTSLSTFHAKQQDLFRANVESLCGIISSSISPSSAPEVYPVTLTPSTRDSADRTLSTVYNGVGAPRSKSSKKDLYAWREIFSLWIESEIFESTSERTRGERTAEEAEKRLQAFANEVVRRGLGDRRTMIGKKSRKSWEEFLRLNVLLLDLKRFQVANINAARKILKKHDKRTALTASAGFPNFVRSTLSAHVDKDGNISTWAFYNTSLPHVLLASLTDTLLPILPSLDDYACLICTSIAFKPIRLGCGHLFCVRCLVKMQRAGKDECPLCRSKVILLADKNSLDLTVMNFMKEWFPKEVKAKQRENEDELDREHRLVRSRTSDPTAPASTSAGAAAAPAPSSGSGTGSGQRSGSALVRRGGRKDKDEKCIIM